MPEYKLREQTYVLFSFLLDKRQRGGEGMALLILIGAAIALLILADITK